MNKDIRDKRYGLLKQSVALKEQASVIECHSSKQYLNVCRLREQQDETYKRYLFYDNFLKTSEKINYE